MIKLHRDQSQSLSACREVSICHYQVNVYTHYVRIKSSFIKRNTNKKRSYLLFFDQVGEGGDPPPPLYVYLEVYMGEAGRSASAQTEIGVGWGEGGGSPWIFKK